MVTDSDEAASKTRVLFASILFEGSLAVAALIGGAVLGHSPTSSLLPTRGAIAAGLVATLPMFIAVAILGALPFAPLREMRELLDEIVGRLFRDFSLPELAAVSIMAGLGEELLFRGLVQGILAGPLGPAAALVLASVLFGLAHLITTTYAVLATAFGLYFGWIWMESGNLAVPVVAHAVYDFVVLAVLVRDVRTRRRG